MPLDGAFAQAVGDFLEAAFDSYGYPLTLLGALVENTFLLGAVLPGGTIILAAAAYAKIGSLQWPVVVLLGWAGMVLGNSVDYWVGRKAFRPLIKRFDKKRGFRQNLVRARAFLNRYGPWAVLAGHFLGHLRSFVAITAGSSRFPFGRYLLFEAGAALAWNLLYCSLGYLLASHLDTLRKVIERTGLAGMAAIGVAVVLIWLIRRRQARVRQADAR
jgi:membrane protein DedA with SNARE-associated domain